MEPARTAWHLGIVDLITQRAPPGIEVRSEVQLSVEPHRADLLLLRRTGEPRRDGEAKVLRGLWPHLGTDTIGEYKSPSRPRARAIWCGSSRTARSTMPRSSGSIGWRIRAT